MKPIYALLGLSSIVLLILGSAITFAGSRADSFAANLASAPNSWSIEVSEPNLLREGEDPKKLLIEYIELAGASTEVLLKRISTVLLVTIGFSGIGWIRERKMEKRVKEAKG